MTESFGVGSEEGDFLLNEESLGLLAAGAAKHDFAHDLGVFRAIDRDRQWAACRRGGRRQAHSMNVRR
jgi:hypothetical protein